MRKVQNKFIIGFILGAIIFGSIGASAATYYASKDVSYDNSLSGMKAQDVQGAIDELYQLANPINLSDVLQVEASSNLCNDMIIKLNYNGTTEIPLEIKWYNSTNSSTDISSATLDSTEYYTTTDKQITHGLNMGGYQFAVISARSNKYKGTIVTKSIYHSIRPDRCDPLSSSVGETKNN